jgi:2-dehydro-3-deoxyphosphooctonate aldolase (KDO 8-P synthase)
MTQEALIVGGSGGVREVQIGGGAPLVLIAGPCVLQTLALAQQTAEGLLRACEGAGLQLIFKASYDKANRTDGASARGPGLTAGLQMLGEVRSRLGIPVTTDVHSPGTVGTVAQTADLLQVPAFLCRQTDLLVACGETGLPVNIKKGQFQAPWDMGPAADKVRTAGSSRVMITERGACFGYNNLVADMRSLPAIRALGLPVCFDATHSVQQPGARGRTSGGQRDLAPVLARAAVAAGVDAVFLEVHPEPESSPSDSATILPLDSMDSLLGTLAQLHRVVSSL